MTFTTTDPQNNNGKGLALNISNGRSGVIDRAIVRFGEGSQQRNLPKFQMRTNSTKVYIPQDNNDYAVVHAERAGEMPVNFKAKENGTYTLSVSESLNSKFFILNYLHLIDNLTGADIDLLATPSYTFESKVTDYESRFKLVFAMNNEDNQNNHDNFAFISNGELIINGTGTLQVFDVLGHQLLSKELSTVNCQLPTVAGVYVLRLINGDDVKTQKIVVR
ncbi:MAG: T9SS type A sorting domain-containing protein, partial [Bacteroidales bacterium]|nr:T9SS type A sorting domain-containing protein [Bacteroidales bacterium]